jgi:hypothetical protein
MNIVEYAENRRKEIDLFEEEWIRLHKESSSHYPLDMTVEAWDITELSFAKYWCRDEGDCNETAL